MSTVKGSYKILKNGILHETGSNTITPFGRSRLGRMFHPWVIDAEYFYFVPYAIGHTTWSMGLPETLHEEITDYAEATRPKWDLDGVDIFWTPSPILPSLVNETPVTFTVTSHCTIYKFFVSRQSAKTEGTGAFLYEQDWAWAALDLATPLEVFTNDVIELYYTVTG